MAFSESFGFGNSTLMELDDVVVRDKSHSNSLSANILPKAGKDFTFEEEMKIIINDSSFICNDDDDDELQKMVDESKIDYLVDFESVAFASIANQTNRAADVLFTDKELQNCLQDVSNFFEEDELVLAANQNSFHSNSTFRRSLTNNYLFNENNSCSNKENVSKSEKNIDVDMFESTFNILDPSMTEEKVMTNLEINKTSTISPPNVVENNSQKPKKCRLSPSKFLTHHESDNGVHSQEPRTVSNATEVIHENKEELEKMTDEIVAANSLHVTALPNEGNEESIKIKDVMKEMSYWNLPVSVLKEYEKKGVTRMFDWQVECLLMTKVLSRCCNLIYCAPTSAGKTLISEILAIKTLKERKKKVLLILPFISVAREKTYYLQDLLTSSGYRVDGFFGGYSPPRGFDGVEFAICTIEKSNTIINRLLEEQSLEDIGLIIVDEAHLISDSGRGYILELLLAKVLFVSKKYNLKIQIAAMSATLPNISVLAEWLEAELYITNFRPVELREMIKIGAKIYDNQMRFIREINPQSVGSHLNDADNIIQLCMETITEGNSVIIFCPSKDWCESLCQNVARGIYLLTRPDNENIFKEKIKNTIVKDKIEDIKLQLKNSPAGLDSILEKTISFACAFHHAGLTVEEREIIEIHFKSGNIRVLVATSTLSSGVNLPARRVIIRSPMFAGKTMNSLTYRQMIGRAGRTGKDTLGESVLICNETNSKFGVELLASTIERMESCLTFENNIHFKRGLLEIISSGIANTKVELADFMACTLLHSEKCNTEEGSKSPESNNLIKEDELLVDSMKFLEDFEFIRKQFDEASDDWIYVPTRLGLACLSSSIPPTEGLLLFSELQKARQHFNLETELHAIYLVTPFSVCYQLQEINWLAYIDLWETLPPVSKRVGKIIGVKESFLIKAMRGHTKLNYQEVQVHKRFYVSLALQELINESQLNDVAKKYSCNRGLLQNLQQMASVFAGIIASFCSSLKWDMLASIISQFKDRLYFGIHQDLIDLVRLPDLNPRRARALYEGGIRSLIELANAKTTKIEKLLHDSTSFESEKKEEHEYDLKKDLQQRNLFVTGRAGITIRQAAELLIASARKFIECEMGAVAVNWSSNESGTNIEVVQGEPNDATNGNNLRVSQGAQNESIPEVSARLNRSKTNDQGVKSEIENVEDEKLCLNYNQSKEDSFINDMPYEASNSLFKNRSNLNTCTSNSRTCIENLEIVDVCGDLKLFNLFEKEIMMHQEIGMSVGIENIRSGVKRLIGEPSSTTIIKTETMNFTLNDNTIISGICFCVDNICFFMNLQKEGSRTKITVDMKKKLLKNILSKSNITLRMYDARQQMKVLQKMFDKDLAIRAKIDDPKCALWLLNTDSAIIFKEMVNLYAPECLAILSLAGKCRTDGSIGMSVNSITGKIRSAVESFITSYVVKGLFNEFEKRNCPRLLKFHNDVEMPIQKVLLKMELIGFPVIEEELVKLCEDLKSFMKSIETEIYKLHGSKFNLLSSSSVRRALQLDKTANRKRISTKHVLEQIQTPLSNLIIAYRKLNYISRQNMEPLVPKMINGRIHGNSATWTSTGRISMHEPNLQNVAKNFEIYLKGLKNYGSENYIAFKRFSSANSEKRTVSCRSVFKSSDDCHLISADFCQLELRILAHLSNDNRLRDVLLEKGDIFKMIAAEWNEISVNKVTSSLRENVKQVCYGIIYGMSSKVLAENLKISEREAHTLIDQFHGNYPKINEYCTKVITFARENGYIETITGRRRYLHNMNNADAFLRGQSERQAVNSSIQGSAADIMKCVILQIVQNLQNYESKITSLANSESFKAELVLHVHDELIFEVSKSHIKKIASVIRRTMENCVQLSVPLPVRIKSGNSWGEMNEI